MITRPPPASWSTVAMESAVEAGVRAAAWITAVPSRMRFVWAAR